MAGAVDVLGPLLTFLSLELAAGGYLVNQVVSKPSESTPLKIFSIMYTLSVVSALYFVTHIAWPHSNPPDVLLALSGLLALISVGAYGWALYDSA